MIQKTWTRNSNGIIVNLFIVLFSLNLHAQKKQIELPKSFLQEAQAYNYRKDKVQNAFAKKNWKEAVPFFGSYAMSDYSRDEFDAKAKANFFGTKSERSAIRAWSYVLERDNISKLDLSVRYNFTESEKSSYQPIDEIPFAFGNDELMYRKMYVQVFMQFQDSEELPWAMLIGAAEGSEVDFENEWILTNGNRKIDIKLVKTEVESDWKKQFSTFLDVPRGMVFFEKNRPLAALQVCMYNNKKHSLVWMDESIDKELQMVLSASMSSILLLLNDENFLNEVISQDWR